MAGPPGAGLVVRLAAPFQSAIWPSTIRRTHHRRELDGRPYLRSADPDAAELLHAERNDTHRRHRRHTPADAPAHAKQATTPLRKQLAALGTGNDLAAVVNLAPHSPADPGRIAERAKRSPAMATLPRTPGTCRIRVAHIQCHQRTAFGVGRYRRAINGPRSGLAGIIDDGLKTWRQTLLAELAEQRQSDDPVKRAAAAYADRISRALIEKYRPAREGERLVLWTSEGQDRAEMTTIATVGVLVALLLPAVQAAREAARRVQSMNNMKQLMLGMLNYESAHGSFPAPARCDDNGKPLLSWRVELLPFLEEQSLYDALHRDEPWDSPHNKKLITQMPPVFRGPNSTCDQPDLLPRAGR